MAWGSIIHCQPHNTITKESNALSREKNHILPVEKLGIPVTQQQQQKIEEQYINTNK